MTNDAINARINGADEAIHKSPYGGTVSVKAIVAAVRQRWSSSRMHGQGADRAYRDSSSGVRTRGSIRPPRMTLQQTFAGLVLG